MLSQTTILEDTGKGSSERCDPPLFFSMRELWLALSRQCICSAMRHDSVACYKPCAWHDSRVQQLREIISFVGCCHHPLRPAQAASCRRRLNSPPHNTSPHRHLAAVSAGVLCPEARTASDTRRRIHLGVSPIPLAQTGCNALCPRVPVFFPAPDKRVSGVDFAISLNSFLFGPDRTGHIGRKRDNFPGLLGARLSSAAFRQFVECIFGTYFRLKIALSARPGKNYAPSAGHGHAKIVEIMWSGD